MHDPAAPALLSGLFSNNMGMTVTNNAAKGFRARAAAVERSLPQLLRRAGRLCAVSLATQTQPFGTGNDAQLMGQRAVVRDIRKVYALPSDVFPAFPNPRAGAAFWQAVQTADWERANGILHRDCPRYSNVDVRAFDGGAAHRANRNNRGRIAPTQEYIFVVQNAADLKAYINAEFKLVGYAKAGWAACARALGGVSGLPGWITRQKAPGKVEERFGNGQAEITLVNQVRYATEVLSESQKKAAVQIAGDRLFKALQIEERKAAEAAGF
jgi:hypothetical protein